MEHTSGGCLCDYLKKYGQRTKEEAQPMFWELISVVQHCYQRGIANHDLKPENILLDGELNIKVIDFGFSAEFSDHRLNTFCGTVSYVALEFLHIQPYESSKG